MTPPSKPRLSPIDRRALLSVGIQFFVNGAATASFLSRLPEIRDQVGVTLSTFGVLLTVIGLFGLASSAVAGRIVHRFGTKRILTVGGIAMVATLPVIGLVNTPVALVLVVGAYFFGDVLVDISMNLQGSWISARRRVPVMNRLHGLWSVGTVTGGTIAAQAAGLSVPLAIHLSAIAVMVAMLLVVVARGLLAQDEDEHADAAQRRSDAPARSYKAVYGFLAFGGAFAVIVEQVGLDWSTFRLADDFGAPPGIATLGFVAFTGGMAIGRFGGDQVQAWLGSERLNQLSVVFAGVGLAVASFTPVQPLVFVGFVLAGSGVAIFMPHLYDEAARAPGRRGGGLGMMTGGMRVGGLFEPLLVGAIAGTSLDVGAAIAIMSIPSVVGYAVVLRLASGKRR